MKTLLTIILFFFISVSQFAQFPQESWLDYNNQADGYGKLFRTEQGYLAFTGFTSLTTLLNGYMVTGLDLNGTIVFQKPYSNDTTYWGFYDGQNTIKSADDGYYSVIAKWTEADNFNSVLVKFNNIGDTLWTKELFPELNVQVQSFIPVQNIDGSLTQFGILSPIPNDDPTPWTNIILHTDSLGNYLWHEEHDGQQELINFSVLAVNDGYIVGGRASLTFQEHQSHQYHQIVRKFDYAGNQIWYKTVQTSPSGAEAPLVALLQLDNGNYLYAGGRSLGTLSGSGETSNTDTRPVIGEIDAATGDTLWEKGFGANNWQKQFFNLKETNDGGYIGVGQHTDNFDGPSQGWPIGFMIKLDQDFNEVWYRSYVPSIWTGMGRWSNLTDVVENDNGTFTAIGLLYTNTGDGPQGGFIQDTYLITVDSLGCIIAGCSVGITEEEISEEILLYPNPANE